MHLIVGEEEGEETKIIFVKRKFILRVLFNVFSEEQTQQNNAVLFLRKTE